MALSYPNVIYRGPVTLQPLTITGLVAGAYLPGTFVTKSGTALTAATAGEGRLFLLTNLDFYTQTDETAYTSGDTAQAYRLAPEHEFRAVAEAAAYTDGEELTITTGGVLTAAAAGDVVNAFADGAITIAADGLIDIVIANSYVKGA